MLAPQRCVFKAMTNKLNASQRKMSIVRTVPALRRTIEKLRARNAHIALVPTMGALHEGHLSLVRLAQRRADRVVVSIFVNPTQFGPNEDFRSYPRSLATDLKALAAQRVDLVWAPSAETMYPEGFGTKIVPEGAAVAGLEDAFRPHFFSGVATVVAKLLIQCAPDVAVFGEKDYQQLKVITQLARDLALNSRIVGGPIVRESDGLARSSRNVYLTPEERKAAPTLYRVLTECAGLITVGRPLGAVLQKGRGAIATAGFDLDYLEARHAETLAPISSPKDGPVRLLTAARLGRTRLIDNIGL